MDQQPSYKNLQPQPVPTAAPQPPAPLVQPAPIEQPPHVAPSPGTIILQWLTYALWGWTVLALSWLIFVALRYVFDNSSSANDFTPYAVASVTVLLVGSVICDVLYSRKESAKKTGFQLILMIIHAVIFALFGIGTLIATIFTTIASTTQQLNYSGSVDIRSTIISLAIITLLYAATLVRTLRPGGKRLLSFIYIGLMSIVSLAFTIIAISGPLATAQRTANDRLIETHLNDVETSIDNYIREKNKLPANLNEVSFSTDTKELLDKNLVRYVAVGIHKNDATISGYNTVDYRYQLCVTYVAKKGISSSSSQDEADFEGGYRNDGYGTYVSVDQHPAGEVCYKLRYEDYTNQQSDNISIPSTNSSDTTRTN